MPRDMPFAEIFQVPGAGIVSKRKVVPDTGTNEHLFHARHITDFFEEVCELPVACPEGWAGRRTGLVRAYPRRVPAIAPHAVHICRRTAYVLDDPFELRHRGHPGHLPDDGFNAPALDYAPLVVGEGTERTTPEAAPVAHHRELNRFERRDGLAVRGVFAARERQFVNVVKFRGRKGQ